jgi:hypothetical protein
VGGLCVAPDPDDAKFPSIPHHLIDPGLRRLHPRAAEMPRGAARATRTGRWLRVAYRHAFSDFSEYARLSRPHRI